MSEAIKQIAKDFWSIRGDFKLGGVLNIGTQASLVKLKSGVFVMLDAYTLNEQQKQQVDALTQGGRKLAAILNLHPFHTVHVQGAHEQYPDALLYGTQRHHDKFSDLPWQKELTESEACQALFAEDFSFSVPKGVDFIATNELLHFSSVLAYHKTSKTIHVDDTLMFLPLPWPLSLVKKPKVQFHPTLAMTLEKRPGAVSDFRQWAEKLVDDWSDAQNLCAAHSSILLEKDLSDKSLVDCISIALADVAGTLRSHEKKYG